MATTDETVSSQGPPKYAQDLSLTHKGSRSLSTISLYGLLLGQTQGLALVSGLYLYLFSTHPLLWRLPFFIFVLCTFHFFEFYITARHNTSNAKVSSYLLFSSNGIAWNLAHSCAMVEIVLHNWLLIDPERRGMYARCVQNEYVLATGLFLVFAGQTLRTLAMVRAGTNFNHILVRKRSETHVLVTKGVYALSRHPSYAGFFWWAVGTQIAVGNVVCTLVYAGVLWRFFHARIAHEEETLVEFFGQNYVEYKMRTRTGIPFIK